jgi:hypothetical protein
VPLVTLAVSAALAGLTLGEDGRTAGTRCPGDQADDDKRN